MNRYNPYSSRYTDQLDGVGYTYQPVYDPSETDRWANLLAQRQQRYDLGQQQLAQMQSLIGGMQTYVPDLLNKRLEDFSSNVENMVNTEYDGDYGLALNNITKAIAKEKSDPFYKLNAAQVAAAQAEKEFKMKNPDTYYKFINAPDVMSNEYFNKALEEGNMAAYDTPYYGETPNTYDLAEKQLSNVKANSSTWMSNLSKSEQELLANAGITDAQQLFNSNYVTGISQDRLNKMADSMAESMLNQTQYFTNKFGKDEVEYNGSKMPADKAAALDVIKQAAPQFTFSQSKVNKEDLRTKGSNKTVETPSGYTTLPLFNYVSDNKYDTSTKKYGTKEGQINLNMPKPVFDPTGKTKNKAIPNVVYQAKEWQKGMDEIKGFENKFGIDWNSIGVADNDYVTKHAIISDLEDMMGTYQNSAIAFDDETLVTKEQKELAEGRHGKMQVRNTKTGDFIDVKNEMDIDVPGMWDKNSKSEDYNIYGIDTNRGTIVAKNKKNKNKIIEYYPSQEAEAMGIEIESVINKADSGEVGVSNKFASNGGVSLTMKVHDLSIGKTEYGQMVNKTVAIPSELLPSFIIGEDDNGNPIYDKKKVRAFVNVYGTPTEKASKDYVYSEIKKKGLGINQAQPLKAD